ncbi:hypothetical protein JOF29_004763 [Kribbella aluminosa]|uniref:Uncharacterized protein n=1 Tax=Kribbella aluminosa TaxID=416017 RepID=A0ABS4UPT7_9ACTN|nr:hypothetical protein [Kribbella aluminosa]MBP2353653.1 hypothetical protein [Kribbella aluminosa]
MLALAATMGIPIAAAHPHAALSSTAEPVVSAGTGDEVCPPYRL